MFKKPVKLSVSVVPTQTTSSATADSQGEAIVFDGKTFTVTFSHVSGIDFFALCSSFISHSFRPNSQISTGV